jgi:hypothetical protein
VTHMQIAAFIALTFSVGLVSFLSQPFLYVS